jgi:hypothetical protein
MDPYWRCSRHRLDVRSREDYDLHLGQHLTVNEFRRRYLKEDPMTRPYKDLSAAELDAELARQLPRGRRTVDPPPGSLEVTAYGDTYRTFLSNSSSTAGTGTTSNTVYWSPTVTSDGMFETDYVVGPDGKPKAIETRPRAAERAIPEDDDIAWLRRRVNEVCWVPA